MVTYKTISLKDYADAPYATLVATGKKKLETRTWTTGHRGPLLIHCSKSSDTRNAGKILCLVDLVEIVPFRPSMVDEACCDWYENAYAWRLDNLRILTPPIIRSGALSIFETKVDHNDTLIVPFHAAMHLPILDPYNMTGWKAGTQYKIGF